MPSKNFHAILNNYFEPEEPMPNELILAVPDHPGIPSQLKLQAEPLICRLRSKLEMPAADTKAELFSLYAERVTQLERLVNITVEFLQRVAVLCGFPRCWGINLDFKSVATAETAVLDRSSIWFKMQQSLKEGTVGYAEALGETLLAHVRGMQMGLFYQMARDVGRYSYFDMHKDVKVARTTTHERTTETKTRSFHVHDLIELEEYRVDEFPNVVPPHVQEIIEISPEDLRDEMRIIDGTMVRELSSSNVESVTVTETELPRPVTTFRYDPALVLMDAVVITGWTGERVPKPSKLSSVSSALVERCWQCRGAGCRGCQTANVSRGNQTAIQSEGTHTGRKGRHYCQYCRGNGCQSCGGTGWIEYWVR